MIARYTARRRGSHACASDLALRLLPLHVAQHGAHAVGSRASREMENRGRVRCVAAIACLYSAAMARTNANPRGKACPARGSAPRPRYAGMTNASSRDALPCGGCNRIEVSGAKNSAGDIVPAFIRANLSIAAAAHAGGLRSPGPSKLQQMPPRRLYRSMEAGRFLGAECRPTRRQGRSNSRR
jgi:hypothetical protein